MATDFTVTLEGLEETVASMRELAASMNKTIIRRVLKEAGQPLATKASNLAPVDLGKLAFSVVVATQLTRRHKSEQRNRESETEVYIGPAGGVGALYYASHVEFGTVRTRAQPFMRPAWDSLKGESMRLIAGGLQAEVKKAADRAARRVARINKKKKAA